MVTLRFSTWSSQCSCPLPFLQKEEAGLASVQKALKVLDGYLLEHTFLVGEAVTLGDIIAACNLYLGMTKVLMSAHLYSCHVILCFTKGIKMALHQVLAGRCQAVILVLLVA